MKYCSSVKIKSFQKISFPNVVIFFQFFFRSSFMVLADLGSKITNAIKSLGNKNSSSSSSSSSAVDSCLREISTALLQSDVNIKQVVSLRKSVKEAIDRFDNNNNNNNNNNEGKSSSSVIVSSASRQRMVQKVVFDELIKMVTPTGAGGGSEGDGGMDVLKASKKKQSGSSNSSSSSSSFCRVVMMVGLQGSGKTTTCTKYAYYMMTKKNQKPALVCADTFRAGV
jgi:signal recognition particle subunit SRP54